MKYVLLFVVAILLMKIDAVIELGEKAWMTVKSEEEPRDRPEDLGDAKEIVRSEDNVKLTPRQQYLNFLDSFRNSPDLVFREKAMALFKEHPMMFTEKLDKDLEARIYSWRDLAVQNTPELPLFLLDLANILKGENREIVTRFFSVVMDLNIDMFIANYPRTKDQNCAPVLLIEAAVPAEEKFPELYERMGVLEEFLARENLPADKKLYANLCLNLLKIYLEKEAPKAAPEDSVPAGTEEAPPAESLPPASATDPTT
ncbi:MAG: hypothetical protein ACJ76H_07065 [Bacteriovoracaceae bacterium]